MNLHLFIARRIGTEGSGRGRMGIISNRIGSISVAVSILIMIIAVAIVAGFKSEIRSKATGFMGSITLVAPGESPINELYPLSDSFSYKEAILGQKNVKSVDGVVYCSGMIKSKEDINGLYFKGVDSLYNLSFFENCLYEGELPYYGGRISNDVLISRRLASRLGCSTGDDLITYFIKDEVKVRKFRICGLYDAQLEELDMTMALVDKRHAQRINGWEKNEVSSFEIGIDPETDIKQANAEIEEILYVNSTDEDDAMFTMPLTRILSNLFDWLALLDLNMLMVLLLMMVVAGFNMISAILIILFEKISMIGLLKSLGMRNRNISNIFLLKAASIVGKGMIWGNIIGLLLCFLQWKFKIIKLNPTNYFVSFVPIKLSFVDILLLNIISAVVIMLIISISTLFISRVSPDKTMRVN